MPFLRELTGNVVGHVLAPVMGALSRARRARILHPDGLVLAARVEALPGSPFGDLGQRLAGPALARFSAALWRRGFEHLDVLGAALRFRSTEEPDAVPRDGDQDLLFATIRSPFTMPFSPLTTNAHDYLGNVYFAVSPFEVTGAGRLKLRLWPVSQASGSGSALSREDRMLDAVRSGRAALRLDARRVFTASWSPVAMVTLHSVAPVDQEALRFSPFRSGRGIVPRGLVHAIRPAVYASSQSQRPASSSDSGD